MKKLLYLAAATLLLAPQLAGAAYFIAQDNITLPQAVQGDVYAAGQAVSINQPVRDDVWAAGQTVEVSGETGQDVTAAGNNISITAPVGDDIHAAGSMVSIDAPAVQDIFAAGNSLVVGEKVHASGDVYLAGETVNIAGKIDGTVRVAGANVLIASTAIIGGDLISYGQEQAKVTVADGAIINGERKHVTTGQAAGAAKRSSLLLGLVKGIIIWFVVALILLYALPMLTGNIIREANARPWRNLLIGLIWIIMFVPLTILLFITVLGWPIALALILFSLLGMILAAAYENVIAGAFIMKRILHQPAEPLNWQQALLGTVALVLVALIPVIGWVVAAFVFLIALGAVASAIGRLVRGETTKAAIQSS